jgi:hypothetical protein
VTKITITLSTSSDQENTGPSCRQTADNSCYLHNINQQEETKEKVQKKEEKGEGKKEMTEGNKGGRTWNRIER